jgi:hypothetical protein
VHTENLSIALGGPILVEASILQDAIFYPSSLFGIGNTLRQRDFGSKLVKYLRESTIARLSGPNSNMYNIILQLLCCRVSPKDFSGKAQVLHQHLHSRYFQQDTKASMLSMIHKYQIC